MAMNPRTRALLALLLIVPVPTVGVWSSMVQWPGTPVGKGVFLIAKLWLVLLPAVWLLMVDRQPLSLSVPRKGGFRTGVVSGLAIGAFIVLAYAVMGRGLIDPEHVRREAVENGIGTWPMYLMGCAGWIFVNSVLEEYVYRWFVFRKLEVLTSGGAAVLLSAGVFTIHHVVALWQQFPEAPLVTVAGSAGVFVGGALWSWMYLRFRSVWPGYVSHAIVDVAVFGVGAHIIFFSGAG